MYSFKCIFQALYFDHFLINHLFVLWSFMILKQKMNQLSNDQFCCQTLYQTANFESCFSYFLEIQLFLINWLWLNFFLKDFINFKFTKRLISNLKILFMIFNYLRFFEILNLEFDFQKKILFTFWVWNKFDFILYLVNFQLKLVKIFCVFFFYYLLIIKQNKIIHYYPLMNLQILIQ